MKTLALVVCLLASASVAPAAAALQAPEIDGTSSMTALALLSGALLVWRGRRK